MVKRIERDRFLLWWQAKRERWQGSVLADGLGFNRSERMARIYRNVTRKHERVSRRNPKYNWWHATHVHSQYRQKRGRKW